MPKVALTLNAIRKVAPIDGCLWLVRAAGSYDEHCADSCRSRVNRSSSGFDCKRLLYPSYSEQFLIDHLPWVAWLLRQHQGAEQEIRQTNEVLEQRTRELGHALMLLRATLDSTTDAILVTDDKFNLTEFNEKYIDMWKVPWQVLETGMLREVQELTSQNFADSKGFIARIEQIVSSERESSDLLELKDRRILERYSKVLTIDGQRAGRVWSFRDVTERHLAEITSHRLAAIVASSDDAIIGKELNSIITSWNFGAERIFGYTADEMIGTSITRLIPPDRQDEELEILSRIRRGERFDHFETIRLAKDGRRLKLSITVSPIKDSIGHVVGASKPVEPTELVAVIRSLAGRKVTTPATPN